MYLIFSNAQTDEILLSKRANLDPVSRARGRTRAELEKLYPNCQVLSPLQRVPSIPLKVLIMVTVYKSRRKDGVGRTCGSFETWAVIGY